MALDLDKIDWDSFGVNQTEDTDTKATMNEALKIDPDKHAKMGQLSQQTGVPQFAVESNPEEVERGLKLNNIDFSSMSTRSPNTEKFLTDFNNAVIAQDDTERLVGLENTLDGIKVPEKAPGRLQTAIGKLYQGFAQLPEAVVKSQSVELGQVHELTLERMDRIAAGDDLAWYEGGNSQVLRDFREADPETRAAMRQEQLEKIDPRQYPSFQLGERIRQTVEEQIEVNPEFAEEFFAGQLPEGFGSMLSFLATSVIGRLTGGRGYVAQVPTVAASSMQMSVGGFEDALASGASFEEAFESARLNELMGPTEALPIARMFDRIDSTTGGTFKRTIKDMLKAGGEELVQEVSQTIWGNLVASDFVEYDPERGIFDTTVEAGTVGFSVGALTQLLVSMVAGRRGGRSTTDVLDQMEAEGDIALNREQRQIDKLNEDAVASTTKGRDPEKFRQFMQSLDDEGATNVYITGEAAQEYLSQFRLDQINADPALKQLSDQVSEAATLGGDAVISTADFATDFAGTEHFNALREHMKLSAETATPAEAEQRKQDNADFREKLIAEADARTSEYVEAQNIATGLIDQLVDTGRMNAQDAQTSTELVSAYVAVKARQEGIGVQEAWDKYGFTVEGPQTGERARLDAEAGLLKQAQDSGFEGDTAIEAKEWQEAVDKGLDMSAEARMERAEAMGFDTEQVWYHGSPTADQIREFDLSHAKATDEGFLGNAVYATPHEYIARAYARNDFDSGVIDFYTSAKNFKDFEYLDHGQYREAIEKYSREIGVESPYNTIEWANEFSEKMQAAGFDGARGLNADGSVAEIAIYNPSQVRSVNAAFDPDFKDSGVLLAQTAAPSIVADAKNRRQLEDLGITESDRQINFEDWFDGSVVVDENGDPRVMYHGTGNTDSIFDGGFDPDITGQGMDQAGSGFYFTTDPDEARAYETALTQNIQGADEKLGGDTSPGTVEVFLAVKNPIVIPGTNLNDADIDLTTDQVVEILQFSEIAKSEDESPFGDFYEEYWDGGTQDWMYEAVAENYTGASLMSLENDFFDGEATNFRKAINEVLGFDGVIQDFGEGKKQHVVAWFPEQIKSIYNIGTFDPTDPDIFKQESQDQARGFYDPQNSIIRLTEASDLSTFIHEFAHFMYETELKSESPLIQSINGWYKRNAAEVAAEANSYLGENFDVVKQKAFHGTDAVFDRFDNAKIGSATDTGMFGRGFYFTDDEAYARSYARETGRVLTVELDLKNPYVINEKSDIPDIQVPDETIEDLEQSDVNYSRLMTEHLQSQGYDGVIDNLTTGPRQFVVFDSSQIKINPDLLAQGETSTAEGPITEADVVAFLDEGTTGDNTKDEAVRRAVHEQFARGFETYIMEGKAPSVELRNAFRRMARWMVEVYRSLVLRKPNLDAEMREVFDRLLATEDQIEAAKVRQQHEGMFTDAAMAGMTETEFQDYQKAKEKVEDKATETLRDKMIKEITRTTEKWWKEERADVVTEETNRLSEERVYRAREALKNTPLKLDRAVIKERYGVHKTDKRGRTRFVAPDQLNKMTAPSTDAIHPDEAAGILGYTSGDEMVQDLMSAPSLTEAANTAADEIMKNRHGDIMNDGSIEKLADEALQNEERGKLMLRELKVLTRGTSQAVADRQAIKDIAAERIGQLSFRQINPAKYRRAEIKAAQESARMLAEGNREGAAAAKARQVMNYYLGMAATAAKADTMKIVDRMNRYNKKSVREEIQKAEGGYWEQIDRILQRFEFRKSATLTQVDQFNESLQVWANDKMLNEGDALVLSNAVLDESFVTHWKNVTYSNLVGINDSVKNIEHVARYGNKIRLMEDEIEFKKLVEKWTTSMDDKVKTRFKSVASVADKPNKASKWGRWMMAQMTKIPYLASWLDGGERAGLSHDILVQPMTDAYAAKLDMWDDVAAPVMEAIMNRSKADMKRHNSKVFIPEIQGTNGHTGNMMGHEILAVALNTGNQSNLKKMLLGEGWANPEFEEEISFNNPRLQAVLSHMTKSDWDLVQLIWDRMEMLYSPLAEVHRKTTGLVPPKVERTPVETPFGEYSGGYYPIKYDPDRDLRAQENEDKLNAETESMFNNTASIQASVTAGATNERTGYYGPIKLSLEVVPNHFDETIHYITHHDAVRQVNKLIRNKAVAKTITEKLGKEEYAQLKPWLNDVAKDGRDAPAKAFWDSMLQRLRFGVTLGAMGFKASTGIIQISGLSNSIAELGMKPVYQSMRSILGSPNTMRDAWEFASENSKVLKHRTTTMDREIKNAMKRLEGKRGLLAATQEASMKHIALIQTYMVDLPTWHAAYIKAMDEHGDERKAYRHADWVIENVQGSGVTKDMARIMRGQSESGRMFTMFMTFFSSLWNMERDLVKGAKSGRYSYTTTAAKAMFLFTIPVLFEMMMRGELGEPEEGEDERLQQIMTNTALYPIQSVPFVRDIASGLTGEFGYNISPMQQILEAGVRTVPELVTRPFTDEELTKGQVKGATKFIGAAVGIPGTGQAWATGEHLYDVMEEGEEFTLHQLLFGPNRD